MPQNPILVVNAPTLTFGPEPEKKDLAIMVCGFGFGALHGAQTRSTGGNECCTLKAPTSEWEFPKIGGTLFWGPSNKDPTI